MPGIRIKRLLKVDGIPFGHADSYFVSQDQYIHAKRIIDADVDILQGHLIGSHTLEL